MSEKKWEPKDDDTIWRVSDLIASGSSDAIYKTMFWSAVHNGFNIFKTKEEAEIARDLILKILSKENAEINFPFETIEILNKIRDNLQEENQKLKKQNDLLTRCAEFYGEVDNWNCTELNLIKYAEISKEDIGIGEYEFTQGIDDDGVGGKLARETIKKCKEMEL